jgi:hypothetical protein
MFMIFWVEGTTPHCKPFDSDEMSEALKFSESLRKQKYEGAPIYFVTLASENPDCVGKQGFDVTGPDYDWKKRRI